MPRRFSLSQNTPLTIVWASGFEYGDGYRDGFAASVSGNYSYQTTAPHQRGSDGGAQHLQGSNSATIYTVAFPALRELVWGGAFDPGSVSTAVAGTRFALYASTTYQMYLCCLRDSRIWMDGITDATSPMGTLSPDNWNWIWARIFIDNSAGNYDVWHQVYENKVIEVTGSDTQWPAWADYADTAGVSQYSTGPGQYDDLFVAGRTMYYTGGSGGAGAPVVGNTLTDGTTGATATIDRVYDSSGTGVVFVYTVSDANSFVSGNTINDGSGWTATASNSLGNDKASLSVPEMFMKLGRPDGDSAVAWSSTGGSNYTEVDDDVTTTDYVSTGTASLLDDYTLEDPLPAGATPQFVHLSTWGRQQGSGSVSSVALGYHDGTGTADSDDIALPTSFALQDWIWTRNVQSGTGAAWTSGQITALRFRLTSKA